MSRRSEHLKTLSQAVAIVCMALLLSMIAHKAYTDISRLHERHSGKQFWLELARYFVGNLAGGGRAATESEPAIAAPKETSKP